MIAGLTFYTLYGPHSPLPVNVSGTCTGVSVAITFVTLPFNVRAGQPLLEARTVPRGADSVVAGRLPAADLRQHHPGGIGAGDSVGRRTWRSVARHVAGRVLRAL